MKYTPRLTPPSSTDKNWIHYTAGGYNYCIKIYGNSCLPNCVGYAWGRWRELLGKYHKLSRGNAEVWYTNTSDGYKRGQTPKLGAVICWEGKGDLAGHVAIVEKINSDGSIVTSNSGYKSTYFYTSTIKPPYNIGSNYKFQGFIYNPNEYDNEDYAGVITYQAYTNKWLPEVHKCDNTYDGFAGIGTQTITGFRCKPQYGELIYQAHLKGGNWLPKVSSKNYNKGGSNSYAGIYGKPIDCIKIKSTKGYVYYRVKTKEDGWLPFVDSRTETGTESYAGIYGHSIIGIQMK